VAEQDMQRQQQQQQQAAAPTGTVVQGQARAGFSVLVEDVRDC
jgi:hypothetical protein